MKKRQVEMWSCHSLCTSFVFAAGLFLLCQIEWTSAQCLLKAFLGDVEVTGDICKKEYNSPQCRDFMTTFNRSSLPYESPKNESDVERPREIALSGFLRDMRNLYMPGFTVSWKPPLSGLARQFSRGFFFQWTAPTDHRKNCRIVELNKSHPEVNNDNLEFRYDLVVLPVRNYTVRVYTLPAREDPEVVGTYQLALITSGSVLNKTDMVPSNWRSTVSIKGFPNGTLDVRFAYPPPIFNMTQFKIKIAMMETDFWNSIDQKHHTGPLYSDEHPYGEVQFIVKESGHYRAIVQVDDPYFQQRGKCWCWEYENGEKSCNGCEVSSTDWLYLNVTNLGQSPVITKQDPVITTHDPVNRTLVVDPNPDPKRGDGSGLGRKELAILVASIVLFAMFICGLAWFCCRSKGQVSSQSVQDHSHSSLV